MESSAPPPSASGESSHPNGSSPETVTADGPWSGYSPDDPKPLAEYAGSALVFNAALATALVAGRDRLPERVSPQDIVLMGVASHKLSRVVTKEKITSFLRAPFVSFEENAGQGEVSETPRGTGYRRVIGELLVCPYCVGQWVTAAYASGLLFAPRTTRFLGAIFAGLTVSDFLQLAYRAGKDKV